MLVRIRPVSVHRSLPHRATCAPYKRSSGVLRIVTPSTKGDKALYQPSSARDAVETAMKVQTEKDYDEAIRLYKLALTMSPTDDVTTAAVYNMGCAYAKKKMWKEATEQIVSAINDHGLKLSAAIKDPDLDDLRKRREWLDALQEVKGGMTRKTKLELRAEAKDPFRFPRTVVLGGLAVGAALALIITTFRLIKSLQGGEGVPDLTESVQNFAINSAVLSALGFVVYRDLKKGKTDVTISEREDTLGRLLIDLGRDRVLPLIQFRGDVRPVILAGSRTFVEKSMKEAEPLYEKLKARGIAIVPIVYSAVDEKLLKLKKEMQKDKGFGEKKDEREKVTMLSKLSEGDVRWELKAYAPDEWQEWLTVQQEFAKLPKDVQHNVYVQVQLDGSVRSSGVGMPPWEKFIDDLPTLSSLRTAITDGVGTTV